MSNTKKIKIEDLNGKDIWRIVKSYLSINKLPLCLLLICVILTFAMMSIY